MDHMLPEHHLIIHLNFQPSWRGGERQVALLAQELSAIKVNQLLFCRKNSALSHWASEHQLNFITNGHVDFSKWKAAAQLSKQVDRKQHVIVHCHESKAHSVALLAKLFFKARFKLVLHRRVIFPIRGYLSRYFKYSQLFVDKCICISDGVRQVMEKSSTINNFAVVPSMIDLNKEKTETHFIKNHLKITSAIKICYIAALTKEKDHYTFLKTADMIAEQVNGVDFFIAGDGVLEKQLKKYAAGLKYSDNIHFLGFVEDIPSLLSDTDLLLFTSKHEGLGSTILDAFKYEVPVVCVKNEGTQSVINNGSNGILCLPEDTKCLADSCLKIINDKKFASQLTNRALKDLNEQYAVDKCSRDIKSIYEEILNT
jgi:glycosyltransferase involved in cell wall biosynthesis